MVVFQRDALLEWRSVLDNLLLPIEFSGGDRAAARQFAATGLVHTFLVSILVTLRVVGVTLLAATLVIPATVARMLTNSFARMLWLATGIGAACGFVGMMLSYHLDWKSGPTIVLTGTALFAVALLWMKLFPSLRDIERLE